MRNQISKRGVYLSIGLLLASTTLGVAASPVCRVTLERVAKHSAATIQRWTSWNKTTQGKRWVATHKSIPLSRDGRALFDRACADIALLDTKLDTMLEEPVEEGFFPETRLLGVDEAIASLSPPTGWADKTHDTTVADTGGGGGSPVFFPPVLLSGGGGTPSTPSSPVSEPPAAMLVALGAALATLLRRK